MYSDSSSFSEITLTPLQEETRKQLVQVRRDVAEYLNRIKEHEMSDFTPYLRYKDFAVDAVGCEPRLFPAEMRRSLALYKKYRKDVGLPY